MGGAEFGRLKGKEAIGMPVNPELLVGAESAMCDIWNVETQVAMLQGFLETEVAADLSRLMLLGPEPPRWRFIKRWLWTRRLRAIDAHQEEIHERLASIYRWQQAVKENRSTQRICN